MSQYYYIQFNSNDYYDETFPKKVKVESFKELKDYILKQLQYLKYENRELEKKLKKRPYINDMYVDNKNGDSVKIGKVIEFGLKGKLTDQQIEEFLDTDYISYWCTRIKAKDLSKFADFEDIKTVLE